MELNFNARTVKPDEGRTGPVPSGWYEAMIVSDETKPNSAGTGEYLNQVFEVVTGGPFKGSRIYHMLNLRNPTEKAMEIAYGQLSAQCHAVNVLDCRNSSDLHNKVMKINVKLEPAELEADGVTVKYEPKNKITAFKDARTETPPSPTAHAPAVAKAAPKAAWTPGAPAASGAPQTPWAGAAAQAPAQPQGTAPWQTPQGGQPQVPQGYTPPPQQAPSQQQQAAAPAWQAPANAQPQPWAQPAAAQQAQQPAGPPMQPAAPTPQPWTPPAAQTGGQQPQSAVPPWAQQPQNPAQ